MQRKIVNLPFLAFLAVVLVACASQPAAESPLVGSKAPDFTLDDALGGQVSLSEYQGTPVLLFFHMAVG